MARSSVTYESRVERTMQRLHESPENALKIIGRDFAVPLIRQRAPTSPPGRKRKNELGEFEEIEPGRYRRSIQYFNRREKSTRYRYYDPVLQIGSKVFYSMFIEFGTIHMRARHTITNAVEDLHEKIQELLSQAIKEAMDNDD